MHPVVPIQNTQPHLVGENHEGNTVLLLGAAVVAALALIIP